MNSKDLLCAKILSFQLWLTVIDLLMSETGVAASGMAVTAKSHPVVGCPWEQGHIWRLCLWHAHKWLSHHLRKVGLHCQQHLLNM